MHVYIYVYIHSLCMIFTHNYVTTVTAFPLLANGCCMDEFVVAVCMSLWLWCHAMQLLINT